MVHALHERDRQPFPVRPERRVEVGDRRPPRLLDGRVAARERHVREVTDAPVPLEVGDEELPAPDRPVIAVPGAVERDAEDRTRLAMLGEDAGDVRVVVLHGHPFDVLHRLRVARGEVIGVQVVRDDGRLDLKDAPQVRRDLLEEVERHRALEVAQVLAEEGVPALGEAERALQLGARRQRSGPVALQNDRERDVPARPAQNAFPAGHDARDGVVAAGVNPPVMDEEGIRDSLQPLDGLIVGDADRLVREVRACHHE